MTEIILTKDKLYLLMKLINEKRNKETDQRVKHNLLITRQAYNKLFVMGIDQLINRYKAEEQKNE